MEELKPTQNNFSGLDLTIADKVSIRLSSKNPSKNPGSVSTHQISFRLPSYQYSYVKAVSSITGATVTDVLQDFVSIAIEQILCSEYNESDVEDIAKIILDDLDSSL
jgi:hypothetical protein